MSKSNEYTRLAGKAEFEKSLNSLLGIIEGITIDGTINGAEITFLENWLNENKIRANQAPFGELISVVEGLLQSEEIEQEDLEDLRWICERLTSSEYFNPITAGLQRLHALLAGIGADGKVTENELAGLASWLLNHKHLENCWPYDEVISLICLVMEDGKIDEEEHKLLMNFFGEFVSIFDNKTIVNPLIENSTNIVGLCATNPKIDFKSSFCFTGTSSKYSRTEFRKVIASLGGTTAEKVTKDLNYLVVGAEGNPNWAFACYGRKVETAVTLRKNGHPVMIIHENDLHKAIASN